MFTNVINIIERESVPNHQIAECHPPNEEDGDIISLPGTIILSNNNLIPTEFNQNGIIDLNHAENIIIHEIKLSPTELNQHDVVNIDRDENMLQDNNLPLLEINEHGIISNFEHLKNIYEHSTEKFIETVFEDVYIEDNLQSCPITRQPVQNKSDETTLSFNSDVGSNINIDGIPNILFESNNDTDILSSTMISDIEVTEDSHTIAEYNIIRAKIAPPKDPTHKVILVNKTADERSAKKSLNKYIYNAGVFTIKSQQQMFLEEYFSNLEDVKVKKDFTKFMEDLVRENYKEINNVCPINYTSHGFTKNGSTLRLYGKCIHADKICRRYKFIIKLKGSPIIVKCFTNKEFVKHPKRNKKIQQVRAVRRDIAKEQMKHDFAANYRNKKLIKMSKSLQIVGNMGDVISDDVTRRIRSEHLRRFARDKDPLIDIILMQRDKKWSSFIQKIACPQEIYLYSKDQLMLTQLNKRSMLKSSRNTIFIDATGSIISKFDKNSKRVFLYSVILHIKDSSKKGILIPVAESLTCRHYEDDIKRFFNELQVFCHKNNILWPITKRIVIDWSWALINSTVEGFNDGIGSTTAYLTKCYIHLSKKLPKLNFVIVQICCCHFIKIIAKDAKKHGKTDSQINFYKFLLIKAINISNIDQIWIWFESVSTILMSTTKNAYYESAVKSIRTLHNHDFMDEELEELDVDELEELEIEETFNSKYHSSKYAKSPFYQKALQIFLNVKKIIDNNKDNGESNEHRNEKFMKLVLTRYASYVPLWTNIMGTFVDRFNTRISNSPAEGYFSIVKNILMKGQRNIRASEYIRTSIDYIRAKINDVQSKEILSAEPKLKKKKTELIQETWKKTPKKVKAKINTTMLHGENIMQRFTLHDTPDEPKSKKSKTEKTQESSTMAQEENIMQGFIRNTNYYSSEGFSRKLREIKIVVGDYKHIFASIYKAPRPFQVNSILLHEFESLNPGRQLFNNVVDIYIHILLYELNMTNAEVCTCEEGEAVFFKDFEDNYQHLFDVANKKFIIIPILHKNHFTFLFANCYNKCVDYIDPLGRTKSVRKVIIDKFFAKLTKLGFPIEE
ncbi:hypothetical protein CVS40_7795 [Lucilia cuprina]|nr:hypothetical protein CVS40_7795 [Lucilia cuprina]